MTNLSPAAQAVLDAFLGDAEDTGLQIDDLRENVAAALAAAAEQIEALYRKSDLDDSDGVLFAMRQLMLIADELNAEI
jgi:hypothetical protein